MLICREYIQVAVVYLVLLTWQNIQYLLIANVTPKSWLSGIRTCSHLVTNFLIHLKLALTLSFAGSSS